MKAEEIIEFDYAMNEQIGARVTRIRVEKGMMSKDVAMRMNITESHYSRMEAGTNRWSLGTLFKVAQVLEVPADILLYDDENMGYLSEIMKLFRGKPVEEIQKVVEIAGIILR